MVPEALIAVALIVKVFGGTAFAMIFINISLPPWLAEEGRVKLTLLVARETKVTVLTEAVALVAIVEARQKEKERKKRNTWERKWSFVKPEKWFAEIPSRHL